MIFKFHSNSARRHDRKLTRKDLGTSLVLLADMATALGVIILVWAFLDLSEEGFLLLTGITLALALFVGLLLRMSPSGSDHAESQVQP